MIAATAAAVPRRWQIVVSKAVVLTAVVLPTALIGVLDALGVGMAILSAGGGATVGLTDSGVLRSVLGMAAYIDVIALMGLGLGILLRSVASSIGSIVAGVVILPTLATALLPTRWDSLLQYLPSSAGIGLHHRSGRRGGRPQHRKRSPGPIGLARSDLCSSRRGDRPLRRVVQASPPRARSGAVNAAMLACRLAAPTFARRGTSDESAGGPLTMLSTARERTPRASEQETCALLQGADIEAGEVGPVAEGVAGQESVAGNRGVGACLAAGGGVPGTAVPLDEVAAAEFGFEGVLAPLAAVPGQSDGRDHAVVVERGRGDPLPGKGFRNVVTTIGVVIRACRSGTSRTPTTSPPWRCSSPLSRPGSIGPDDCDRQLLDAGQ